MKLITKSLLAAAPFLLASASQAAIVTYDFTVTATDISTLDAGLVSSPAYYGTTGTGSFTFDDADISGVGVEILGATEFDLDFTLFGQTFTGTNDINYPFVPELIFNDGVITGTDFLVSEGPTDLDSEGANYTAINETGVFNFLILDLLFNEESISLEGDFYINVEAAAPVPVPAAVWLFGSGLLGLVGVARRRT